jgi:hypothetical protein
MTSYNQIIQMFKIQVGNLSRLCDIVLSYNISLLYQLLFVKTMKYFLVWDIDA